METAERKMHLNSQHRDFLVLLPCAHSILQGIKIGLEMTCRAEEGAYRLSRVTMPLYTRYLYTRYLSIHGILGVSLNSSSVETEDAFSQLQNKEISILQWGWV